MLGGWIGLCVAVIAVTGCDSDSFIDPSVTGRWEHTPVTMPILGRLDIIDEVEDSPVGLDVIQAEDLIPIIEEYKLGVSDFISIEVFELMAPGQSSRIESRIDVLGYVQMPVLGRVKAAGLTIRQFEQRLKDLLHPNVLRDPTVTVTLLDGRQDTYKIVAPNGTGIYDILMPEWRLLDALALARIAPQGAEVIYVIRQTALFGEVEGRPALDDTPDFIPPPPPAGVEPLPFDDEESIEEETAPTDTEDLLDLLQETLEGSRADESGAPPVAPRPAPEDIAPERAQPLIDALEDPTGEESRWVSIEGKWVEVKVTPKTGLPAPGEPGGPPEGETIAVTDDMAPEDLMTQRVIEVNVKELLNGNAAYNVVVRPGDTIRIPLTESGFAYVGGQIRRPGAFNIPGPQSLTLTQLIISAGGLGPLAVPERVDLTRRIGPNMEATIRLNLRAIAEGVQPNIYVKADDTINIGTNIFMQPLLVIRNGFRMSYGFGFILDRNFANDVYGPINDNNN